MDSELIKQTVAKNLPGSRVEAVDLTGSGDHFGVHVEWEEFRGKTLIEQHQLVNRALQPFIEDGRIHALKIKTVCP